jgi:hypothetical protein
MPYEFPENDPFLAIWRGKDLDELIPPSTVTAELPRRRRGAKLALQTVYRWMGEGCDDVPLRYAKVGGMKYTTRRWLAEFFAALAAKDGRAAAATTSPTAAVSGRTAVARRKADEQTESELKRRGF